MEGPHDFNKHSWFLPATRGNIFNPPEIRNSWGGRALEAWFIGPAWDHYRCLKFQLLTTGGIRFSSQYKLYPQQIYVPIETPKDKSTSISRELIESVKKIQYQEKKPSSTSCTSTRNINKKSKI